MNSRAARTRQPSLLHLLPLPMAAIVVLAGSALPLHSLTAQRSGAIHPAPSPDGTRLAFSSDRTGDREIWIRDLGEGTDRRITHDSGRDDNPTWSPDGSRLAFQSDRGGAIGVWVVDAAGRGEAERLTPESTLAMNPAWSPDGTRIAVASGTFPDLDLWLYPVDGAGAEAVRLTRGPEADYGPAWTPNGQRIVFVQLTLAGGDGARAPDRARSGLAVVEVTDGGRTLILPSRTGMHEAPAISLDGGTIAFQSTMGEDANLLGIALPGGSPVSDPHHLLDGPTVDEVPAWTADPVRLYFQRRVDEQWQIWVMEPDGSAPRPVLTR